MEKIAFDYVDKIKLIISIFGAVLTYAFGEHWPLFAFLLAFNVIDVISGVMAERIAGKVSSKKGTLGLMKKMGSWLMIIFAFLMSSVLIELGTVIHMNFSGASVIGWAVLIERILNEIRSIMENLVRAGYNPPKILTKGLEVANRAVEEIDDIFDDDKDNIEDDS